MKRVLSYTIFVLFFFFFSVCSAQTLNLKNAFDIDPGTPLGEAKTFSGYQADATPEFVIAKIISVVLSILGILFIALMIYGGYLWMTAMGKEQQVTKAKDLITRAIVGLIIIVGAYAVSYFVTKMLVSPNMNQQETAAPVVQTVEEGTVPFPH